MWTRSPLGTSTNEKIRFSFGLDRDRGGNTNVSPLFPELSTPASPPSRHGKDLWTSLACGA